MPTAVHTDIAHARTPSAAFYTDAAVFTVERERVFARAWQLIGHTSQVESSGDFFTAQIADEPLLIVNDGGTVRGFYNVCRHRAGPVAQGCGRQRVFACRYHGWTYDLAGRLLRAPESDGIAGFDLANVHLEPVAVHTWGPLVFASLDRETTPFEKQFAAVIARCAPLELERMRHVMSRDYVVDANWKVYVDNYLEGYHIPLVHPGLNREIDYRKYVSELGEFHTLQHAPIRKEGASHYRARTEGDEALYYWLFPNIMLNIYQGQMQANIVIPQGVDRALVRFDWYAPEPLPDMETDARWRDLIHFSDEVQGEDASICELVQRNLRSRAYRPGPYSPARENGVHHFHRLMAPRLSER
jgi:choline monooxygenase